MTKRLSLLLAVVMVLSAMTVVLPVSAGDVTLKQSPFLDARVESGELPPVEERLPKVPKLTNDIPAAKMDYQIGQYGGTIHLVTSQPNWDADCFVMNNTPMLNSPGVEGLEVTANVFESYEVSEDQMEFTFKLREGMRWSDGEYVTMEDVRFTMEDLIYNPTFTPAFPQWMRSGASREGTPAVFTVVDDWTFKLTFDVPYGGLVTRLSVNGWRGYTEWLKPSYYLKRYHIDYATDADKAEWDALCDKYNIPKGEDNTWVLLLTQMNCNNWDSTNPNKAIGFPMLNPWIMVGSTESVKYYERNPYYFKVDKAGNQLPYIDKIESKYVQDMEMVQLAALAGEVDFMRESATMSNVSLYKENEKAGGFKTYMAYCHVTYNDILLNMTYDGGPGYQEMVRDVRFRKALSLALDREEMIDTLNYGYADRVLYQDGRYAPDEAEALLQEMGMVKGADGFYLQPDGNPFTILIEVGAESPNIVPASEMVVQFWRDIGINASFKRIESQLVGQKQNANELQCRIIWTSYPHWPYMDYGLSQWGRLWQVWRDNIADYTQTKEDGTIEVISIKGEEPPEEVKAFYRLIDRQNSASLEEAIELYEEIRKSMGENYWFILTSESEKQPLVCNAKLRNITEETYAIGVNFSAPQLWYAD